MKKVFSKYAVLFAALLPALVVIGVTLPVQAQEDPLPLHNESNRAYEEVQQITLADAMTNDFLGNSIALYGDTLMIGAPFRDANHGAVYVYQRDITNLWTLNQMIPAKEQESPSNFGYTIALEGDTAVIGAPAYGENYQGIAYVYKRDVNGDWQFQQKLKPPVSSATSIYSLGIHLAISADMIALSGTISDTVSNLATFVYRMDENQKWQYETALIIDVWGNPRTDSLQPLPLQDDASRLTIAPSILDVALEGDKLMVGYQYQNGTSSQTNVYQKSGGKWELTQEITVNAPDFACYFGRSIQLRNTIAFIAGLVNCNPLQFPRQGTVYAYQQSADGQWLQTQKLLPNDADDSDDFGSSLAFDGTTLAVGSPGKNNRDGAVYLFGWDGTAWVQQAKLTAEGTAFGTDVAVERGTLAAGAPEYNASAGIVYLYDNPATDTPELLAQRGFETKTAGWTVKNATGDKVKCDKNGKTFAYEGTCAWRFKGGKGENAKLQQVLYSGVQPGDTLVLSGYVNADGAVDSRLKLVVVYLDPSLDKQKLIVDVRADTGGVYVQLSDFEPTLSTSVTAPPEKVKVVLRNKGITGKVYYDALSLTIQ
jgi:hypothetical protein